MLPLILGWTLAFGAAASLARAGPGPYAAVLRERAARQRLAEDRYWRLLLRYRRTWLGGPTLGLGGPTLGLGRERSESPSPDFFLAKNGRRDPSAELDATLDAFFEPESADPALQHPQCRFPARYGWLKERLGFDLQRLPEAACSRFQKWRRSLDAESVTLIFATAFLNSPASMYGHTFLKFDRAGLAENQRLLDYTLNYAAYATDSNPLLYAARGLAGGYEGRYSLLPYYVKVQEYTNLESRDLWEYKLRLDAPMRERLIRHSWELGSVYFPYYFLNRNCSYQLLPLLDAADPGSRLTPGWRAWVIPADTIRRLQKSPLRADSVRYRPSRLTLMRARRARLTREETRLAADLAEGDVDRGLAAVEHLASLRQALILDAAADFILYRVGPNPDPGEALRSREQKILAQRGKISQPPLPVDKPADVVPPDEGHPTARVSAGFGAADGTTFQEITLRSALHDSLDPPAAYVPYGSLEMGHLKLRYDNEARRPYLQSLTLLELFSPSPWDWWVRERSWKMRTGLETADEFGTAPWNSFYYGLRVGRGLTMETSLWRREALYAFLEADAGAGAVFRDRYRLGAGASVGVIFEAARWWRGKIEGAFIGYPFGDMRDNYAVGLTQNFDLSRSLGARLALERRGLRREMSLAVLYYF